MKKLRLLLMWCAVCQVSLGCAVDAGMWAPANEVRAIYFGLGRPSSLIATESFGPDPDWETGYAVFAVRLGKGGEVTQLVLLESNVSLKMQARAAKDLSNSFFEQPEANPTEGCAVFFFKRHDEKADLKQLLPNIFHSYKCDNNFPAERRSWPST